MLLDISAAWQRTDAEQRLGIQNFLFRDGVAYHQDQKFLNTNTLTLFQQLSADASRKSGWRPRRDLNPRYRRERGPKQTGSRCNYKAAVALQCPVRNS
jgi:hypothetical protein